MPELLEKTFPDRWRNRLNLYQTKDGWDIDQTFTYALLIVTNLLG
jgi:hypothetical protein